MSSTLIQSSIRSTVSTSACWNFNLKQSPESGTFFDGLDSGQLAKPDLRDLSDNNSVLISVYYFIKNFIGGGQGASSAVAIDTKIEEALDLVKSNLMFAVREEVDMLKEKIDVLMNRVNRLEFENRILRAHASSEALSLLDRAERRSLTGGLERVEESQVEPLSVLGNGNNNNLSPAH